MFAFRNIILDSLDFPSSTFSHPPTLCSLFLSQPDPAIHSQVFVQLFSISRLSHQMPPYSVYPSYFTLNVRFQLLPSLSYFFLSDQLFSHVPPASFSLCEWFSVPIYLFSHLQSSHPTSSYTFSLITYRLPVLFSSSHSYPSSPFNILVL